MKAQDAGQRNSSVDRDCEIRNPFGVMDVPNPNDQGCWSSPQVPNSREPRTMKMQSHGRPQRPQSLRHDRGNWSSRWNGGADPTIPGDAANKWKLGQAEVTVADDRIFILFDWDNGARRGLIDARREDTTRLVGKYINLTDPKVTRPWIGLIVSNQESMDGGPEDVWISAGKDEARKLNRGDKEPVVSAMKFFRPARLACNARLSCVATGRPATDLVPLCHGGSGCWALLRLTATNCGGPLAGGAQARNVDLKTPFIWIR